MTWAELGVVFAGLGFVANLAAMIYGYGKLAQEVDDLRQSRETHDKRTDLLIDMIHKVETDSAKTYVTVAAVAEIRADVNAAVSRITDRLDRVLDGRNGGK